MSSPLEDQRAGEQSRGAHASEGAGRPEEAESAALLEIARDIGGSLEIDEILDRVQRRAAALLPCDRVATFYWDTTRSTFRLIAEHGIPGELRAAAAAVEFAPGQPIVEWAMQGQTVLINDGGEQQWLPSELLAQFDLSAVLGVPLLIRGQHLGVIVAALSGRGRGFDARQVRLFEAIAQQVALALGTAELFKARQAEAAVAAALARVGQELILSLDRPALLERVCRLTTSVLQCDCSHTLLWDAAARVWAVVSGYGDAPEQWEAARVLRIPATVVSGLVDALRRDDIAQVIMDEPRGLLPVGFAQEFGVTAGMYVALRRGDELIGMQTAGYRGQRMGFTAQQERIFRGLAQLASLALENARVVDELEQANRLKYDFVATMSHELRTPLNVIMGYSDLLLNGEFGPLSGEQAHIARRIDRSARELHELIDATLDLSRLEGGRLVVQVSEARLSDLLRALDDETRDLQQKPGVEFHWQIPARLPVVHTDPLKLKVIVKNLIANAVKFTDRGSVTVSAGSRRGGIEITVSDTGVGIAPDARELIFEPFRQVDSSAARRHGGVGLGLYIARRLVDMLGGTIAVDSQLGRGATFRVWLPVLPSAG